MACIKLGRGAALRITELNDCCSPVPNGLQFVKRKGVISFESSTQTEETDELVQNDWTGDRCINEPSEEFPIGLELTLTLCDVCPCAVSLVTGQEPILNWAGEPTGFSEVSGLGARPRWALELWVAQPAGGQCDPTVEGVWAYMLMPCNKAATIGDFTLEDGTVANFPFTTTTRDHSGAWCRGPYDVLPQDGSNTPGKLIEPIKPNEFRRWDTTTVPPPADTDGECIPYAGPVIDLDCDSPAESPAA